MSFRNHFKPIAAVFLFALVLCLSVSASAFADDPIGNESFQKNLQQFPGLYSTTTGTTMPVFQFGSSNILEAVYVECPLDTDRTGKRDFIRVTIRRPAESGQNGVRVPVLMQDSPYIDGSGMSAPNYSITGPLRENDSTENLTYEKDIKSIKPRASEWPWGDDAVPELGIPASRGERPLTNNGRGATVTSIYGTDMGTFASYFVPRGYAIVSTNSIGNRYSDGYTSCGDVDETVVAMAVINWLNGKCRAYTDQNATNEVDATVWCNGNVAMSGVSYDGTLPIAVACSGVEGLKAAIPASAISSWYDYYRENGGVCAPGGYQGEDAVVLARYCFSRNSRVSGIPSSDSYYNNVPNLFGVGLRTAFETQVLAQMLIDQDRGSGDYNRFWDDRNYIATADKVTAGIIVTHGLNDWNVKMKQFDQLYRAVKAKSDAPIKLVIGRGGHGGIYTHEPLFDNAHKWLDHFLYGIDNGIVESMPEVSLISSQTGRYEEFDSWPVSKDRYTKYYFNTDSDGNGAAGSLSLAVPANVEKKIKDLRNSAALATWETRILGGANLTAASTERLAFVSNVTQNVRFSGTVKATLEVASDIPFGYMTAALVEIGGSSARTFSTTTARTIAAHNGITSSISITRPSGVSFGTTATSYKLVALGHADVQNPNPSGKTYMDAADTNYIPEYYYKTVKTTPGQFYSYTFEFEPNDWEFRAGNKMAIMVYTTDYRYTPTPAAPNLIPELTIKLGAGSYVEIPALSDFNTLEPIAATFLVEGEQFDKQIIARGAAAVEPAVPTREGYRFDGWFTAPTGGTMWNFATAISDNVTLYARYTKYNLTVYMQPAGTTMVNRYTNEAPDGVNEIYVDVMLVGDIAYTQLAASVAYDNNLLEYIGYDTDSFKKSSIAGEIKKDGADKVYIRSVPTINMLQGATCVEPVRIVTLKFAVKKNFEGSVDTTLSFASSILTPKAGAVVLTNSKPLTYSFRRPGNAYLNENISKFPNMFNYNTGRLNTAFSDSSVIQEQVWIEVPVDTDFDGKRDLQRIIIRRPTQTRPQNGGLKCPAIIGMTPYHTTGGTGAAFASFSGRVYDGFPDQGPAATRFQHTAFDARPAGVAGVLANRDHWTQILGAENDMSYRALRDVTERRVGKGAEAGVARYLDLLEDGMLKATEYTAQQAADYPWLPPARVPTGWQLDGASATANPGGGGYGSAATNLPYGYAMIQVSILGSDYAQGLLQYGMYQESLAAAAVFDWLNGRIRGFTGPDGLVEVEAYWATGEGVASGTSYGGTLPVAAAVTGVQGLRSIYPGAPVTNAYNYYRENALPYAPGGYQGEDITSTTYYTQGRFWSASAPANPGASSPIWDAWWDWELYLRQEMKAENGDYSPFWDERNPLSFGFDMRKDVGVIMGAGLNDGNVKFRHTALLNEMLKHYEIEVVKGQFTQGEHTMGNSGTGVWTTAANMREWVDLYLYGVASDVTDRVPNYHILSNIGSQWVDYDTWPVGKYQKFYPVGGRVGALSGMPQATVTPLTFKDDFLASSLSTFPTMNYTTAEPTGAHIRANGLNLANGWLANALVHQGRGGSLGTVNNWRNRIVGGLNNTSTAWSAPSNRFRNAGSTLPGTFSKTAEVIDRVIYRMPIPENFTISGAVSMSAEVAVSKDVGALSAMVLEWWNSGIKVVAVGSVDVRNPNPDGTLSLDVPGIANISKGGNWHANYLFQSKDIIPYGTSTPSAENFNKYTWEMDITEYTFTAGRELCVILFGSDPEFTYVTKSPTEFTVNLGPNTYLSLPVVKPINIPAVVLPAVIELEEEVVELVEAADEVEIIELVEEVDEVIVEVIEPEVIEVDVIEVAEIE